MQIHGQTSESYIYMISTVEYGASVSQRLEVFKWNSELETYLWLVFKYIEMSDGDATIFSLGV